MPADGFTKLLSAEMYSQFTYHLGMVDSSLLIDPEPHEEANSDIQTLSDTE